MANKLEQQDRGVWKKNRNERGVFLRGHTWYIRFRDQNGKLRAERVGPSKSVALRVYGKRKTEVAERRFFPATGVSFEEIVRDAITRARDEFRRNHPEMKFKSGNYGIIKNWFPGRAADSITPSEIAAKLTSHTKVPATFNRFRVAISHAYKIAIENKKVSENPGIHVRLQKEDNERVRYLNQFTTEGQESEESRLRSAIQELCPQKEAEVDFALHTGLRWSEQYSLTWRDVDLIRGILKLARTKGGKVQYVPINAEARRALLKLKALAPNSEVVCPENNYDQHRDWWLGVLRMGAIEDFTWHDLRHTFASRLVMKGVDIFTVCRLLRHKNVQTTMRYAHLGDKHLAAAVAKLAKRSVTPSDTAHQVSSTGQEYLQ